MPKLTLLTTSQISPALAPRNACITTRNATVLYTAPTDWSSTNLINVFVKFNFFCDGGDALAADEEKELFSDARAAAEEEQEGVSGP